MPDLAQSTVANRYRDDRKRGQRPKTPQKKRAKAGGGGSAAVRVSTTPASHTSQPVRYAVIDISDSDELQEYEQELRNDGASSSD